MTAAGGGSRPGLPLMQSIVWVTTRRAKNKTPGRKKDFWSYYESDKAKRRAKFVFGPFMRHWGYEFPESWGHIKEPWHAQLIYDLINIPSKIYWKYLM